MKIRVRDTTLFFDVEGAGLVPAGTQMRERPTLILLHGGPGFDHSGFKPQFSALADVAQIVYLDHRGNGRSDRDSPERWTLADWADDLKEFCDALGIEKPIVLGQSFGGMVAMAYGSRHPGHAGKLILSSTSAKRNLSRVLEVFARLGGEKARQAAEAFWLRPGSDTLGPYTRECFSLYNQRPGDPESNARTTWNLDVMFEFARSEGGIMDLLPDLRHITCPTLVLVGEDDPITPLGDSQDMVEALPPSLVRLEVFAKCGHGVFRDDPERGMASIRRFLLE